MKKILYLILIIGIIATVNKPVFADGAVITLEDVSCRAGETVETAVSLSGNIGFSSLGIEIAYDSAFLSLVGAEQAPVIGASFISAQSPNVNPYNMGWDSTGDISYNGKLVTLTFEVRPDAPGGSYPVTVSHYKGRGGDYTDGYDINYNKNYESLNLSYDSGVINVIENLSSEEKIPEPEITPPEKLPASGGSLSPGGGSSGGGGSSVKAQLSVTNISTKNGVSFTVTVSGTPDGTLIGAVYKSGRLVKLRITPAKTINKFNFRCSGDEIKVFRLAPGLNPMTGCIYKKI